MLPTSVQHDSARGLRCYTCVICCWFFGNFMIPIPKLKSIMVFCLSVVKVFR
jgi:hypothetical protein